MLVNTARLVLRQVAADDHHIFADDRLRGKSHVAAEHHHPATDDAVYESIPCEYHHIAATTALHGGRAEIADNAVKRLRGR